MKIYTGENSQFNLDDSHGGYNYTKGDGSGSGYNGFGDGYGFRNGDGYGFGDGYGSGDGNGCDNDIGDRFNDGDGRSHPFIKEENSLKFIRSDVEFRIKDNLILTREKAFI